MKLTKNIIASGIYLTFLLIIINISAASISNQVSIDFKEDFKSTGYVINLDIDISDFQNEEIVINNILFNNINLKNSGFTNQVGKARLPVIRKIIAIPPESEVSINIKDAKYKEIKDINVIPVQKPQPDMDLVDEEFNLDREFYSSDIFFPSSIINVENSAILRDYQIVQLEISPFQFNPINRILRVYTHIEVELVFNNPPVIKSESIIKSTAVAKSSENSFLNEFYTEAISNYDSIKEEFKIRKNGVKLSSLSSMSESVTGAEYLIIVADNLYNSILTFEDWKQQKGLQTKIVKTSTISDTNSNGLDDIDIYNYIYNAFHNWDISPVYVLLVGDVESLPTHYGLDHPYYSNEKVATDHYYATISGDDYFADLFIGRLSAKNSNELNVITEKIINHEKNIDPEAAWRKKALLFHGLERPVWEETSNFVYDILTQNGFNYINVFDDSSNRNTQVRNSINNGRFFINYRGHGSKKSWANVPFDNSDISRLSNENMLPIVISPTCEAGWFDYPSYDSFGETWLKAGTINEKKGGVAFFGASRVSYSYYNDELSRGFFKAVFNDNINNLGQATNKGKLYMYNTYGGTTMTHLEFELFNLMGDPEMNIIPRNVQSFSVYNDGESDLLVTSITGPSWATFNPTSFTVSSGSSKAVTIIIDDGSLTPGTYDSTISVYSNDPDDNPIEIPISVEKSGNNPPEINPSVPDITTEEDTPTTIDLTPYENDVEDSGLDLVWSISDINHDLFYASIDTNTDELTITPVHDASGNDDVVLTLRDSGGAVDTQIITVTINPAPDYDPPVINVISPLDDFKDPYTIIKYNVSDKSEITNCSLQIDGIVRQTDFSVSKKIPQYFFINLSNGNYEFSIRCVDSNNNQGLSISNNFYVNITPSGILLIDDDEGFDFELYYQKALIDNNYAYHKWDSNVLGSPTLDFLNNYRIVIWFTSNSYASSWMQGTLNANETILLMDYLDNGGKLFFSSQDYLYDYYGYGINKTNIGDFAYDYLYVDQIVHDTRTVSVEGVDGDEITHGLGSVSLLFPFADYSDRISILPTADVIFTSDSKATALRVDNNISKVVFFVFPFETIELESDRTTVMQNVIQWLDLGCIPTTEGCDGIDNDCDGFIDENLTKSCGIGVCQGFQTCMDGNWSLSCSSYLMNCGTCTLCDELGQCSMFDENCSCVLPTNEMVFYENSTLCHGVYNLSKGVSIGADNIYLDCNESILTGNYENYYSGIRVSSRNNVRIRNCIIRDYTNGISFYDTFYSTIENNIVENDNHAGGSGISIAQSNHNRIINNTINEAYYGLILYDGSEKNFIEENTVSNNDNIGLLLHTARPWDNLTIKYNIVKKNTFERNHEGFVFWDLSDAGDLVRQNNITENVFYNHSWISLHLGTKGYMNNFWSNEVYDVGVLGAGNNNFCVNNEGNNYYQGANGPSCDLDSDYYYDYQDCNDLDSSIHPGAIEFCNGIDDDCDELLDGSEDLSQQCGISDIGLCSYGTEVCDDTGNWINCNAVFPGTEIPDNGIDEDCDGSDLIGCQLQSPLSFNYSSRRIDLRFTCPLFYDEITYSLNDGSYRRLCRNCDEYDRSKSFVEGDNNLIVRTELDGSYEYYFVNFTIDSRSPRISKTEPSRGYSNGKFTIKYTEDNPVLTTIHYKGISELNYHNESKDDCLPGRNQVCQFNINVTPYDGNKVEYFFTLTDLGGSMDDSRPYIVDVDETPPVIGIRTSFKEVYGDKKVLFDINVTEEVDLTYLDHSDSRGREKRICRSCDEYAKEISFKNGFHNITIFARDDAGNQDNKSLTFFVDYTDPKISRMEPRRNYATGDFMVRYTEDTCVNLLLNITIPGQANNISYFDCDSGRNVEYPFFHNISRYDGKVIDYEMTLFDIANNTGSKSASKLLVDTIAPEFQHFNWTFDGRYVIFNISLDGEAKIRYIDYESSRPSERALCSRCDEYGHSRAKKRSFGRGDHNITIIAEDKAGNRQHSSSIILV